MAEMDAVKGKFVAVLVRDLGMWLWFKSEDVEIADGQFRGNDGWGDNGEWMELHVAETEITGRIQSNTLGHRDI